MSENIDLELPKWEHPTGKVPKCAALVALGRSRFDYDHYQLAKSEDRTIDEVWAINRGIRLYQHDIAFILDDLEREAGFDPHYGEAMKANRAPIITSHYYADFDDDIGGGRRRIHAYPLEQMAAWVAAHNVRPYFHNSIPMVIAYACLIGVETLLIHGADYTLPDGSVMELSRANVEYWCGVAEATGMRVGISRSCRLLGAQDFDPRAIYGYDRGWEVAQAKIRRGVEAYQAARAAVEGATEHARDAGTG